MSQHDDLYDEFRSVVAGLRANVEWRHRGGAYGASAAASPRPHVELPDLPEPAASDVYESRESLAVIREDLGDCTRCKLHDKRQNIVFGVGDPQASLMFVGEAPGADEDRKGEPFVGRAGQLLDKMIAAMGWTRDTVYIANVLKCRPPGNRDPEPDEIEQCEPFLFRQIESIAPKVIVTLGRPATHLLLKTKAPISRIRGKFQLYDGHIKVMPTFHPAYLLRSPDKKRDAWSDLQTVIAELEAMGVQSPSPPKR